MGGVCPPPTPLSRSLVDPSRNPDPRIRLGRKSRLGRRVGSGQKTGRRVGWVRQILVDILKKSNKRARPSQKFRQPGPRLQAGPARPIFVSARLRKKIGPVRRSREKTRGLRGGKGCLVQHWPGTDILLGQMCRNCWMGRIQQCSINVT